MCIYRQRMTKTSEEFEDWFAKESESLVAQIFCAFPPAKLDSESDTLVDRSWVDAMRMGGLLRGKLWTQVSAEEFARLDSTGVHVGLARKGFACYLPMFMTHLIRTKQFGWFEEMLIPVGFGLEDVVEYFSGWMLEDLENTFRDLCKERVAFVNEKVSPEQRACIARYVEIAERYGQRDESPEFERLIRKYADFWTSSSFR